VNPFWAGSSILGIILPTELEHHVNPTNVDRVDKKLELHKVRNGLRIVPGN
jgi:hypothetical protein